jgi:UDP-N-acetylmuramoylalanine-D-glutamate ligase
MDEAVATAARLAQEALLDRAGGTVATVVLSPAAASFDMFEDYAARGRAFIEAVAKVAAASRRDAGTGEGRIP